MGKPRKKGMRKGYLRRFSSQAINKGAYAPHKPTLAEYARRPRSMGSVDPKSGMVTHHQAIPPTKDTSQEIKEKIKRWEVFVHNERHQIKPEDIKFAPQLSNGVPLPIGPYHLCFVGNIWFWFHKKEGDVKRSVTYHSAKRAEYVFFSNAITWNST